MILHHPLSFILLFYTEQPQLPRALFPSSQLGAELILSNPNDSLQSILLRILYPGESVLDKTTSIAAREWVTIQKGFRM